jgi:hypothetical protein
MGAVKVMPSRPIIPTASNIGLVSWDPNAVFGGRRQLFADTALPPNDAATGSVRRSAAVVRSSADAADGDADDDAHPSVPAAFWVVHDVRAAAFEHSLCDYVERLFAAAAFVTRQNRHASTDRSQRLCSARVCAEVVLHCVPRERQYKSIFVSVSASDRQ